MSDRRISVVLPVYNEDENIGRCLRGLDGALEGHDHELLVCYDFDEDTTLAAIAAMPDRPASVRLVKNELGRGAANALRAGFAAATGDVVVTSMADLSDPPELIPDMAAEIRAGADVVSGSRYMPGGSQEGGPWLKSTLSRWAGVSMRWLSGIGTHDPTSNFRAYSKRLLQEVAVDSQEGFDIALELTVKAHLAGHRVSEVPSSWVERDSGESRFRLWRWLPGYLGWYWRAVRAPLAAWTLLLALAVFFAWFTRRQIDDRGLANALLVARTVPAGLALLAARGLRGRNTWLDLLHPLLWLLPLERWTGGSLGPVAAALAFFWGRVVASAVLLLPALLGRIRTRGLRSLRPSAPTLLTQGAVGVVTVALLFAISTFRFPEGVARPVLDPSWKQGLGYAIVHGLRHGLDITFTFGPLGYFNSGRYNPELLWTKVLWWELGLKFVLAFAIAASLRRMGGPLDRVLFCLALFLPNISFDAYFFLASLALTTWAVARPDRSALTLAAICLLLSFVALVKFTCLVLVVCFMLIVALHRLCCRGPGAAVLHLVSLGACFAIAWTVSGQSLVDLPAYLDTASRIAGGYSEAMAVVGPGSETLLAAVILGLVAVMIAANVLAPPASLARTLAAGAVAASVYLSFKAGFTRHGGNSVTFFAHAPAACCLLLCASGRGTFRGWSLHTLETTARVACVVLALWGYARFDPATKPVAGRLHELVTARLFSFTNNLGELADLDLTTRSRIHDEERARKEHALPRVRAAVGGAPIDYMANRQAYLFLNDLRWHPRPIFQSYSAYTPELQDLNGRFYASERAPEYVLFGFETINYRLPAMSDAAAVQVMSRDYAPVLVEAGQLLLERRPDAPRLERDVRELVLEREIGFLEEVDLTGLEGRCLLLELDLEYTLLGKLRKTFLRAPIIKIDLELSDGTRGMFRVARGLTRRGVIVAPFLSDQDRWIKWFCGQEEVRVAKFHLRLPEGKENMYAPRVKVRVTRADGLVPDPAPELLEQMQYSMFETPPDGFSGPLPPARRMEGPYELLVVRTPAELSWNLAEGRHALRACFGFRPLAYKRGETDGAGFAVVVRDVAGEERVLFERYLDPENVQADRALQTVELEVEGPGELLLRTDPGGDAQSDDVFWSEVSLRPEGAGTGE